MTTDEKTALFNRYRPLAFLLAHKFANRYRIAQGLVEDESLSLLGTVIAQWESGTKAFNPARSCATSWVYRSLTWSLASYCGNELLGGHRFAARRKRVGGRALEKLPARTGWFEGIARDLGEDARVLVETIVAAPSEIAADLVPRRWRGRAAGSVKSYMQSKMGWSPARLAAAWNEVELSL